MSGLASAAKRGAARSTRPARSRSTIALAVATLAITALTPACSRRTDARVRKAWGGSTKAPDGPATGANQGAEDDGGQAGATPIRVGWDRVDEIVGGAVEEARLGTDDEVMARLAERWCEVEPTPLHTEDGIVRVCVPDPPVQIEQTTFTLELGGAGVIGLVATELSDDESSRLAAQARRSVEHWCTTLPWNEVKPPSEPSPSPAIADELVSCVVEGSALLSVARVPMREAPGRFQVSVVVIDAS